VLIAIEVAFLWEFTNFIEDILSISESIVAFSDWEAKIREKNVQRIETQEEVRVEGSWTLVERRDQTC
jgi:hypothetical protein